MVHTITAPEYFTVEAETRGITVDCDKAFPAVIKHLFPEQEQLTQYIVEVANLCIRQQAQKYADLLFPAASSVVGLRLRMYDPERKWRIANFPDPDFDGSDPKSRGSYKAVKGLEARQHYQRMKHL